ncbi:hypothetical protein DSO57_1008169 [Entomophthora muscae]|uniref:Uncharacterized protein n=1 Tax=Entomophthora muscae TaxID=34485 RepID=A0ACC2T700_9FUNG|nr:hypothetical protein DSO57_1008169 [Entomophthora muscae]
MKAVKLVILLVLGLGVAAREAELDCLEGLDISLIGGETYKNATFYWNTRLTSPEPAAVICPKNTGDVICAVKCAAKSTSILVRSGRHSFEGYWQGNKGGVVVDLRNMKKIEVNKKKRQVTVKAGALIGHLFAKLWEEDKGVLPHGLQIMLALVARHLAVDLLLDVDENNKKDLFFALCGAGDSSFGVVTQFTFSYIKDQNDFNVAHYNWNAGRNNFTNIVESVMKYYNSITTPAAGSDLTLSPGSHIELCITYSDERNKNNRYIKELEGIIKTWDKKDVQSTDQLKAFLFFDDFGKQSQRDIETLCNTPPVTW